VANRLKMAEVSAISTLLERGWSQRQIARTLGIDRGTVSRYTRLRDGGSKAANAPPGSDDSKPANAPPGSLGRSSQCAPLQPTIQAKLEVGLSARRIYQDLVCEHGFQGSYYSVRRFVHRLTCRTPLPFRRMECAPGEEAQVDFGSGAPVLRADGKRRRPHVLRVVLSHSRKGYSEVVERQTTENFIRCLENAFWHFGGVPKTLVIDNLKAAVTKADWFDPELNPKIQSFSEHYGTVILPTKVRTPRHKGKIERGIGYVQDNALKGHEFTSLEHQNRHLLDWEVRVADTRIHGTTQRQVRKVFEEVERPALLPMPRERFPCFTEARRKVHRDAHVEVVRAYYSVPPEYVGRVVWARWDTHTVRVFNLHMEQIALHVRRERGHFSTNPLHLASEKISSVEQGAAYWLTQAARIGPHSRRWAEAMVQQRGVQGLRPLIGLVGLVKRHSQKVLEQACEVAHSHGAYHLRTIRQLIKHLAPKQQVFEFADTHPIIRSLTDYEEVVQEVIAKEIYG
jgi:transposase